jgi:hypothetical protein
MFSENDKKHITPQQAQDFLSKRGVQVSEKEASIILDFLYKIAILERNQKTRKSYENS